MQPNLLPNILAQAAPATGQQQNPIMTFLPMILLVVVFYFILIRPQQKRAKEQRKMLEALKSGDKVITSAGIVLGSTPVDVRDVDLRLSGCVLYRNGEVAATGAGGAVLGSPINALVWLANTLAAWDVELAAGQVVLPGSQTAAMPVEAGDSFIASFGGIGTVTAHFASGAEG